MVSGAPDQFFQIFHTVPGSFNNTVFVDHQYAIVVAGIQKLQSCRIMRRTECIETDFSDLFNLIVLDGIRDSGAYTYKVLMETGSVKRCLFTV